MNEGGLRLLVLLAGRHSRSLAVDLVKPLARGLYVASCFPSTSGPATSTFPSPRRSVLRGATSHQSILGGIFASQIRTAQTSAKASGDYYTILGLPRDATDQDIKKSYYKLAKQYHPDTNKGNAEAAAKFQEVQKAYETLRDPEKRRIYDQVGREGMDRMENEGGFPGDGGFQDLHGMNVEDIFSRLHPNFRGFAEHIFRQTMTVQVPMRIGFMESVTGAKKTLNLNLPGGFGVNAIDVDIPAGIQSGQQIGVRLPRKQQGQPQLDVMLIVEVEPHPTFKRDGPDIVVIHKLPLSKALLGCITQVDTIYGPSELQVPACSQNNDRLVMRGKGTSMPGMVGRGNQVVILRVEPPKSLNSKQRELLQEFQKEEEAKSRSWFG